MTSQARLDEFAKKGIEAQKKHKKATTTGLLKWKVDWEQAARWARDMVKNFRSAGPDFRRDYIQALKDSAKAHEEMNDLHTAGADYEHLATALKEDHDLFGAAEANVAASRMFRGNSEWDKAATVLCRAADCIEEKQTTQALSYMDQACKIFEEMERYDFHEQTFKKAISMAVKNRRYDTAIDLIYRQNAIIEKKMETFERDMYKNILSVVVIRFSEREYEKAQKAFNKAQNLYQFGRSEEWAAASDLLTAYSAGSNEELEAALKRHSCFKYLSVPIAQLARKLQFNSEVVAAGKKRAKEFLEGPDIPDSDEEEEEEEDDEEEEKTVPAKYKATKKPIETDDAEDDEEETAKPVKKATSPKPTTTQDSDDDEPVAAKKPTTSSATTSTSTSTSAAGKKQSTRAALFDRGDSASDRATSTRSALFAKESKRDPAVAAAATRSALFAKSSDEQPKKKKVTSPKSTDDDKTDEPQPSPKKKSTTTTTTTASNPFDDDAPTSSPDQPSPKKKSKKNVTQEFDDLDLTRASTTGTGEGETGEGEPGTGTGEGEEEEAPKTKKAKKKKKKHDEALDNVQVDEDGMPILV